MKNNNIKIFIMLTFISFMIGFSYAYFSTVVVGNTDSNTHVMKMGSLQLTLDSDDLLGFDDAGPGDSIQSTFTVKNTGNLNINNYEVIFSNVINTLVKKDEVVYTITCSASDATSCSNKTETEFPATSGAVLTQGAIAPNTTHTYTITLTFKEMGVLQDYNENKQLSFKVTINETQNILTIISRVTGYEIEEWEGEIYSYPIYRNDYFWQYSNYIVEIVFEDEINIPLNAYESWDISETQDESIMAYVDTECSEANLCNLYIQADDNMIFANDDMSGMRIILKI